MVSSPKNIILYASIVAGCAIALPTLAIAPPIPPTPSPTHAQLSQVPLTDTTLIPGERVGPVTRNTTREDLARIYGEINLSDEDIYGGEGETEPGTIVNLDSGRSFTVIWTDESRSEAAAVVDLGTAWRTPEGIGVGTSFADLKQKLGDFQFYGFEWDYGGFIVLEDTQLEKYYGSLILQVYPSDESMERSPSDFSALLGDDLFSSNDPHLNNLDITIHTMAVYLMPPNRTP